MSFPASPRVIYEKNPLETVICQLRFPPILRIGTEAPAGYQERIRGRYPLLRERAGLDLGLAVPPGLGLPPEIVKIMTSELGSALRAAHTVYDFGTADDIWKVTLSRDFLAVTTKRYVQWEEFREHLQFASRALLDEYSPAFFTRTGLRYKNVIRRSELSLEGRPWAELLGPHIAAELSAADVSGAVIQAAHEVTMLLREGMGQVRVQHGLGEASDPARAPYVIDADFFSDERTEAGHVIERLDYFNSQAGRLFRWCIQELVHEALGPRRL